MNKMILTAAIMLAAGGCATAPSSHLWTGAPTHSRRLEGPGTPGYVPTAPQPQQDARNTTMWTTPDGVTHIHVPDAEERMTGMTHEQLARQLAEAMLENEAIIAMNGGHWPANWPTNPPAEGQMSDEEVSAMQKDAQRRIDAIRAANGGQLPSNWRELIAQSAQ
jgi:hypothetical protein